MNLITRNNYEAYLLDYFEKNLSSEVTAELMLFLENNPDLKEDLNEFEIHELVPSEISLVGKNKLKKDGAIITLDNCEEVMIAEIEGENANEISAALHLFLKSNPDKNSDFITYQKTKLLPSSIVFADKKSLKKKEGKIIPLYWWYTSAAAVIIILVLLKGFNGTDNLNPNPIADKEEEVIIPNEKAEEILPNKVLIEDNKVAVVEDKKAPQNLKSRKKTNEKALEDFPYQTEEILETIVESTDEIKEILKDTLFPKNIDEQEIENIHYADNVKITYEDELVAEVNRPEKKFETIGQIITKPLKNKFLKQEKDANGEVTAYAINVAGFSFARNKRKRKN